MSTFFSRFRCFALVLAMIFGGLDIHSPQPLWAKTPAQQQWLDASINQRVKLAEEIGERGAEQYAKSQGWKPVLQQGDKAVPQGFDQVYKDSSGRVHVVEAKGGTSAVGKGYGHAQGTSEWAVEAAKKTIHNGSATAAEKKAAEEVLNSAAKGKTNVHVIRTEHVLGEPTATRVESSTATSSQAKKLAKDALAGGKHHTREAVSTTQKVATGGLSRASKVAGKLAVPIAVGAEVITRGGQVQATEQRYKTGEIDNAQRAQEHSGNVGGCVGGVAGAYGGATAGAAAGAAVGSVVPVVGTAIGGFVGGVGGGAAGYFGGDWAGEKAGRAAARMVTD